MIEEGGGGVVRAGCACLSPVALKSAARCALRTLPGPAPDGTATPLAPLRPTFAPFPTTFQPFHIPAGLGSIGALCMATWKVFRTWKLGKFSAVRYWRASLLWITDTAGPLADSSWGKIVMDRVYGKRSEKGNQPHALRLLELSNSGWSWVWFQPNPKTLEAKGYRTVSMKYSFPRDYCWLLGGPAARGHSSRIRRLGSASQKLKSNGSS